MLLCLTFHFAAVLFTVTARSRQPVGQTDKLAKHSAASAVAASVCGPARAHGRRHWGAAAGEPDPGMRCHGDVQGWAQQGQRCQVVCVAKLDSVHCEAKCDFNYYSYSSVTGLYLLLVRWETGRVGSLLCCVAPKEGKGSFGEGSMDSFGECPERG